MAESMFAWNPVNFFGWLTVILLFVIAICTAITAGLLNNTKQSSFVGNDPNNIRRYVEVGNTSQDGRQVAAVNAVRTSGMTGSRDIPVFFQDYDYDMTLSKTGLKNSREGVVGGPEEAKKFTLN